MAGLFLDENVAQGLRQGPGATFQAGINDVDDGAVLESGQLLPWVIDPEFSWLDYICWIECELDSGMVIHRPLPQSAQAADSLGVADIGDPLLRNIKDKGVNLVSVGQFTNIVQRMATSVYRFCLKGWARRAGYQVPIPKMISVCGLPAIPDDSTPQRAMNVIIGNNSGIPVWFARWELWYTLGTPPRVHQAPPDNLSEHIGAVDPLQLPTGIQVPLTYPDQMAISSGPALPPLLDPIQRP